MPLTNFPQGLSSFGFPLIGSGPIQSLGNVWFVDSAIGGNAPGYGTDKLRPFATIAYALTKCTANNDDVIFVSDGHTESIAAAAGWTTISGVRIIGLGRGAKRPTITFTATASQVVASGNNTTLENLVFDLTGIDAVVKAFAVTGTDLTVSNCRFVLSTASAQAVIGFGLDTGCARPAFLNCEVAGTTDAGPTGFIIASVAVDGLKVIGGKMAGNCSGGVIGTSSTFHLTNVWIDGVFLVQYNGTAKAVIVFTTTSSGYVANCRVGGHTWATAADAFTNGSGAALFFAENYGFDNAGGQVSGVLVPAVGTVS